jgi:hypothetical protein
MNQNRAAGLAPSNGVLGTSALPYVSNVRIRMTFKCLL